MKVLIQCKRSSKVVEINSEENLYDVINRIYGLNKSEYFLKIFNDEFKEYIDLEPHVAICHGSKIKIEEIETNQVIPLDQSSLRFSSELLENPEPVCEEPEVEVILNLKKENWPNVIQLPIENFSKILKDALESGEPLNWDCSRELVAHMALYAYKYKTYPSKSERQQVCFALLQKFPHLKNDVGLGSGGWEMKLLNKLKKMRQGDTSQEVATKKKAYCSGGKHPKRAKISIKAGQINWAPDHFPGEDETSQAFHEKMLLNEYKKCEKDQDKKKLQNLMSLTFSFRRQMINENVPVGIILEKYPIFFQQSQQFEEFQRLTSCDLHSFVSNAQVIGPKLLDIMKAKKIFPPEEKMKKKKKNK